MNWRILRNAPWLDTRARFVAGLPRSGALLDLGSSDGETLNHIAELRPDLRLHSVDIAGRPENYPSGCSFVRADLQSDLLPWSAGSMDGITCMHLVEHLTRLDHLISEVARLLKPGGMVYFETPHPKTVAFPSPPGDGAGRFTYNFYDDITHVRPVSAGGLARYSRDAGLEIIRSGISRNWLFFWSYPLLFFAGYSRQKMTARAHFHGWTAYLIASKSKMI